MPRQKKEGSFYNEPLVAEMGFEPHDLRVMSPTSYQTAPLRDMMVPEAGVEPVRDKISRDFKSRASANSAIPAKSTTLISHIAILLYHTKSEKSIPFFVFPEKSLAGLFSGRKGEEGRGNSEEVRVKKKGGLHYIICEVGIFYSLSGLKNPLN